MEARSLISIRPKRLVTKFSLNGEEQDFSEWTWLVEGEEKDAEITSLTSLATGPKSTMFMILQALLGADAVVVGAGFDEKDLVGRRVMVQVVEQDGFSKIDKIVAAPRTKGSKPAPAPVPAKADEDDDEPTDDLPF
jgi:hypothetical protein